MIALALSPFLDSGTSRDRNRDGFDYPKRKDVEAGGGRFAAWLDSKDKV
jgi:hypothetical protein